MNEKKETSEEIFEGIKQRADKRIKCEEELILKTDEEKVAQFEGGQKFERSRITSLIKREIENWKKTTYCEICGSKLELQDIEKMVWACRTMEQDLTKEGMLKRKEGRNAADEHYSKSRRYYSFEWEKTAETVLKALQDLLKKISLTEKEGDKK